MNDEKVDPMIRKQLSPNEQVLWKQVERKNILKSNLLFFLAEIFLSLGVIFICLIFFPLNPFAFLVILMFLFSTIFSFNFIIKVFYDRRVKMGFPPDKEALRHYTEYTVITNRRLLQKRFYHHEVDVPERWRKSHTTYDQFKRKHYPHALMKKEEDIIALDLTKINVLVDYKDMDEIYFLEEFIIQRGEYVINYSENIFWPKDPYLEFVNIIFKEETEQEKVVQILKEEFNLTLVYEDGSGRIYKREEG